MSLSFINIVPTVVHSSPLFKRPVFHNKTQIFIPGKISWTSVFDIVFVFDIQNWGKSRGELIRNSQKNIKIE